MSNMLYKRKHVNAAIPKTRYGIESLREKNERMGRNTWCAI